MRRYLSNLYEPGAVLYHDSMRGLVLFTACCVASCGETVVPRWERDSIRPSTGHLQSMSNGKSTSFDVTSTATGGRISGILPGGEHLQGEYHLVLGRASIESNRPGTPSYTVNENSGNAIASLVGDRGTVLECSALKVVLGQTGCMEGFDCSSHGQGVCTDQEGGRYVFRF